MLVIKRGSVKSGQHPKAASAEELALVRELLAGNESVFEALIDRYHGQLVRLALVFVADRATAEEVAQETWLGVLNGLPSFEGRSTLKSWIFRILTNRAKTRGVRDGRTIPFSALASDDDPVEAAVDPSRFRPGGMWVDPPRSWEVETPESLLEQAQTRALLGEAIAQLPANQRAVLTLRDIEGLDSSEVCNILEISETNVRVLVHRARSRLRGALEQHLVKE